ncbi:family 10 glycosylhydrolase [Chitinophagaceae bacterium LB-8]|uniref:Family 10 glycosylhydrolase n=1 Tax=Paraflavisolibacter caeni TaxID=2982496 RepID=A0A9X2XUN0_9BACT|nr:family 10 glycosylhydrolase [Paraflavisolibacter caeni]MCU7548791.1 family 10 glycosylhydrolase [Paraflavisolibacter caeni]
MTNRRNFFKNSLLVSLSPAIQSFALPPIHSERKTQLKHWAWIHPKAEDSDETLKNRYKSYYEAGIRGIFFEADVEKHFRIAKGEGLETHRWIWTLNRGEQSLLQTHPEWYSINRKGESCADKPPYVNYYRWLCPSREEVIQYLENEVRQILDKEYVDGIHLDYVRFCDVILPVNLWSKYGIEQTKELPQYDYCYCSVCREKFKEWKGMDIAQTEYPEANLSWRLFRYQAVTKVVNRLSAIAHARRKPITAAVFPTPEVARRNVRQDWVSWNLSGICPMIYHGFYKENISWIGDAVGEGIAALHHKFPLYAGLYLPDFKDQTEIRQGIKNALERGASGVSLFGNITDEVLSSLKQASAVSKKI